MRGPGMGQGKGRGRGRGRGRGLRRFLEPVLLLRLHKGPAHGYSLLEGLDELGLGGMDPSMLYRVLREMEDLGWVSSTWDEEKTQGPPRRIYQLSTLGDEVLAEWAKDLEQSKARIERFLRIYRQQRKSGPA
jgi:poly-beta-hydroxybutyrate-responsive repressor